jgi:hypothetical protein
MEREPLDAGVSYSLWFVWIRIKQFLPNRDAYCGEPACLTLDEGIFAVA